MAETSGMVDRGPGPSRNRPPKSGAGTRTPPVPFSASALLSPLVLALLVGLLVPFGAQAQDVPEEPEQAPPEAPAPQVQDPAQDREVTPAGAFVRSLLIPGWGQVATGAPSRGAFYIAAQSATGWMLAKSVARRRSAQRFRAMELAEVEADIRRSGVADPDSIRFLARQTDRVEVWDDLIERRDEQVEDWLALGIFLVFLGATDAFVSGHLADFPEPLSVQLLPAGPGGRWEMGVSLPAAPPWRR